MPSESVAGFLDHAQANRVLFPEQVEQLIRQPDIPQSNLDALCDYLLTRGVLTRFQASAIRDARSSDLAFAGYPVIDDLGPCPGGRAYQALHPSLRTPLLVRRIRADWLAPADNATNYVGRARAFGMLAHPNLVHLIDAGLHGDEVYVVIDQPADAADLAALSREVGGAMPGFLAAEYGRAVASALRMAHERGGAHGDVRPDHLIVGPLAVKTNPDGSKRRRPAPDAVVRLAELGLVPVRPPATAFPVGVSPYLPPERLDTTAQDPHGDVYGLGASLYFLLAGRPPFPGDDPDLLAKIRTAEPTPLATLRPDLPPDFVALVGRMLAKRPGERPATAYEVEAGLIKFCRPGSVPPQPVSIPTAVPASAVLHAHPVAEAVPVAQEAPAQEEVDAWGVGGNVFDTSHTGDEPAAPRKKRGMTDAERARGRMLMILGGLLHLTAIALLVMWLMGVFEPSPEPTPAPSPEPKAPKRDRDDNKPPPRKSKNNS